MIWLLAAACLLPVGILLAVTVAHGVLLERHTEELDDAFERIHNLEDFNERRSGL